MANISAISRDSLTISGLSPEEREMLEGALSTGNFWVSKVNGKLEFHSAFEPLPDPIQDKNMLPFWKVGHPNPHQSEMFDLVFEEMEKNALYYPHITISSLCGYNYSEENYKYEAEKLQNWGFIQMRSQRKGNGKYWEFWYLPGVWAAKSELKEVVEEINKKVKSCGDPMGRKKDKDILKAILGFLGKKCSFGSLDVSVQRMCAVTD